MKTKSIIKDVIYSLRNKKAFRFYSSQFKHYLEQQGFDNKEMPGEDAYIRKWSSLSKNVEPYSYRFFSHFCGPTPNIIPEDIGHSIIEDVLCPPAYRGVYSDKNLFPVFLGRDFLPRVLLCRINGGCILDSWYKPVNRDILECLNEVGVRSVIVKPTIHSSSGRKILKFEKTGKDFVSIDTGTRLTKEFLLSYSDNFCVQETITQHSSLNSLCSTSINTIRLCLYKSIKTNESIVTAAVLRIGKDGKYVDNAHAGGVFTGIDIKTGKLGECVFDQFGNKSSCWNGVDYSTTQSSIPNWENVLSFAGRIGDRILHHRLIALDIALKEDGEPILVEYNIGQFSFWLFMYTNQEVFGEYTDEIIEFCKKQYPKFKREFKTNFGYILKSLLF